MFDTGHVKKDTFSEVLIRLNRVRAELETVRKKLVKLASKKKVSRENPAAEPKDRN